MLYKQYPRASVMSFDQAQSVYPKDNLVDMEASGFFQAASRLVTQEQVQIIKIISDNNAYPARQVNAKKVSQLIENQLGAISQIVEKLLIFSKQERDLLNDSESLQKLFKHTHFTTYQQHQVKEFIRRCEALKIDWQTVFQHSSAQSIIQLLRQQLDQANYIFSEKEVISQ